MIALVHSYPLSINWSVFLATGYPWLLLSFPPKCFGSVKIVQFTKIPIKEKRPTTD
ncbi:hypothetical protein BYT27DRAFT_7189229 [Phlegmacium glaucopus]|nr:hypothetical protein BYT27DRAFT_7189229 [Phlegmacium glaucopus]